MRVLSFLILSFVFIYLVPHFVLAEDLQNATVVGHGVTVQTKIVPLHESELVKVIFSNPAGELGTVILSKKEASKKNISYQLADQKVTIKSISLTPENKITAASSVVIDCKTTDTRGGHKVSYKGEVKLPEI